MWNAMRSVPRVLAQPQTNAFPVSKDSICKTISAGHATAHAQAAQDQNLPIASSAQIIIIEEMMTCVMLATPLA